MKRTRAYVVAMLLAWLSVASAQEAVYFPGEGYLTPSEKSMQKYRPGAASTLVVRSNGAGDDVSVHAVPIVDNFPYVKLLVDIYDSGNEPVLDLTVGDVTIRESVYPGAPYVSRDILCFSDATSASGISFSLVFDTSGSMEGERLADAKDAVNHFIGISSPNDKGALVTFAGGGSERIVVPLGAVAADANVNGIPDLTDAVNRLESYGSTAVFDAMAKGMDSLAQVPNPKVVILFSDGETNDDKRYDINQVIQRAQQEQIILYTIGLGVNSSVLRQLAEASGGEYYFAPEASDMVAIYSDIYDRFSRFVKKQYHLIYKSADPEADAGNRTYQVSCRGGSATGSYTANHPARIVLDSGSQNVDGQAKPAGAALVISGSIEDLNAKDLGQNISASLYYRSISASSYTRSGISVSEDESGRFRFQTVIPAAQMTDTGVEFYIAVTDGIETAYAPADYATHPCVVPVLPNHAPSLVHTPVTATVGNRVVSVDARLTETDSGQSIGNVFLYYRIHDVDELNEYTPIAMIPDAGGVYSAEIPASQVTALGIDYFVSATDSAGTRVDHGSPRSPHVIVVDGNGTYAPVADAGPDQAVMEGAPVRLDGSGSHDPNAGDDLEYTWEQVSGPAAVLSDASDPRPSFTAPVTPGGAAVLVFQLRVTDTGCIQSMDTVYVTVGDSVPSAGFSWSPDPAPKNVPITFADETEAGSDEIVSRVWDFGGLGQSHDASPAFTFTESGTYEVALTVTDADGSTSTYRHSITVAGSAPVADAGLNRTVEEGSTVTLDGSNSSDPDAGETLTYHWAQESGPEVILSDSEAMQPSFTAPEVENENVDLVFRLTTTDSDGLQSSAPVTITVRERGCEDCDANAGCFIVSAGDSSASGWGGRVFWFLAAGLAGIFFLLRGGRFRKLLFPLVLAAVMAPFSGHSEILPHAISVTPHVGGYVFDTDQDIDVAPFIGAGVQYHLDRNWGVELKGSLGKSTYHYPDTQTCCCEEEDVIGSWIDFGGVYHFRPESDLVPYLAAGLGFVNLAYDNFDDYSSAYVNYGGGVQYFFRPDMSVRADARHIYSFDEGYNNLSIWAGVSFFFGGEKEPVPAPPVVVKMPEPEPEPEPEIIIPVVPVVPVPEPVIPKLAPVYLSVVFGLNQTTIQPEYARELDNVAEFMKENPDLTAVIEGHTCNIGSEKYNMGLSKRRAEAVRTHLVTVCGIEAQRLEVMPFGESSPIADNRTAAGRAKNRRVVIQYREADPGPVAAECRMTNSA